MSDNASDCATSESSWLRTLRPAESGSPTIICFPHAGGGVLSAAKLARSIPDRFGLVVAVLPGREPGDTAVPPRRAAVAGAKLAGDLADHARQGGAAEPLVLLGNSYGSLLAFETARSLQAVTDTALGADAVRLIVSGFRSPSLAPAEPPLFRLPTRELFADLSERYGVPLGDLAAAGLYEIEAALRADLEACDTYRLGDGPLLRHRIDVLRMTRDPSVSHADLRAWCDATSGQVVITDIEADHFPWASRPDQVADAITSLIADPRS